MIICILIYRTTRYNFQPYAVKLTIETRIAYSLLRKSKRMIGEIQIMRDLKASSQKIVPGTPSFASGIPDPRRWLILILVILMTFMDTLDSSIVNVALPTMSENLGVNSGVIAWVVAIYLIVISASILVFGRLGDIFGQTRIFKIGIILFTVGSALCGISHSLPFLLIGRSVQAIGASATMANSQGIITRVFPGNERGRALGFIGSAVALGSLTGPALGGLIVSVTSWDYIFWINIPIGIICFALCMKFFPKNVTRKDESMDLPGAALFTLFIVPLFFAINQAQVWGISDPRILAGIAVAIVALVLFIIVEKKSSMPLLDLTIFKNTWFTISIICGFLSFVVLFTANIVHPFYLQDVREFSPGTAGLLMTVSPLLMGFTAPVAGYLSDRIGSEVLTLVGLSITAVGMFLMATMNQTTSVLLICVFVGIVAVGNANFQSPNTAMAMSTVSRDKLGIGGSVNALARNLGMITGISLSTTLLYGSMSRQLGYHVTGYVAGQNESFLYGMRIVYLAATGICLVCVVITAVRLFKKKSKTAA